MKSILPVFLGLLLFTLGAYGACSVRAVTTARSGATYQVGSGVSQIYDVVVTNDGSCGVNNIGLSIGLPSGASISSSWNLQAETLYYTVTSFGDVLPVGNSVNVGFIVLFPNTQTVPSNGVTVSVYGSVCNACINPTTTTTGSPSTTSSTAAASTTSSTSSQTTTGTPSNSNCHVTATATARSGGSFPTGNGISQIYDLIVTNDGSCGVNNVVLRLNLPAFATISSSWNLNQSSNLQYTLTSYQRLLPIGNSVNAGFIVLFPNTQTVPRGVSVTVPTTTCNSCSNPSSTATSSSGATTFVSGINTGVHVTSTTGSGSTTNSGGSCSSLGITITARPNGSYHSANGISQIYDLTITNNGNCEVTSINLSLNTARGSITSSWNLSSSGNNYALTNFGGQLLPRQTATAGIILEFTSTTVPNGVSASLATSRCNC